MKIDLKKLNASAHASIPFDETIDLTDEKLYGAKPFQSPVHIKGVVSNESGVVRLAGSIETIYSTECARCLKPLEIPLSAEADMMLSDDPEAEEEDDLFVLTSDSVDPADVLVPALILQVQMTYLCKEDCKGLCPICGSNLNQGQCGCKTDNIDPRFESLRSLFKLDEEV